MILNLDKVLVNNSVMLNGISNKKRIKHAMNNTINLTQMDPKTLKLKVLNF